MDYGDLLENSLENKERSGLGKKLMMKLRKAGTSKRNQRTVDRGHNNNNNAVNAAQLVITS